MARRTGLLTLLVWIGLAGGAQARTVLFGSPGTEQTQLQQWVDQSQMPTPHLRVRLRESGECPACMEDTPPTIWIVPFAGEEEPMMRFSLLHEVGHLFSDRLFSVHDRREFGRLDGKPRAAWNPGDEDRADSPHEDFGNDYAFCATGLHEVGGLTPPPNLPAICELIRTTARTRS